MDIQKKLIITVSKLFEVYASEPVREANVFETAEIENIRAEMINSYLPSERADRDPAVSLLDAVIRTAEKRAFEVGFDTAKELLR